jgi:hypothetical protein
MQRGGTESFYIRRYLLDQPPVSGHQQDTERAYAHNLIVFCYRPGSAVIDQQGVSRQLFLECHRFQLSLPQSASSQDPA